MVSGSAGTPRAIRCRPATGVPGPSGRDQSFADLARVVRTTGAARRRTGRDPGGRRRRRPPRRPSPPVRWLFSHNGAVKGWPGSLAPARAGAARRRSCCRWRRAPTRRSLWALVLHRLRAGDDAGRALADTVLEVAAAAPGSRLNLLLTDGDDDRGDHLGRHPLLPDRARPPHRRGLRTVRRRSALAGGTRPHPARSRAAPRSGSPRSRNEHDLASAPPRSFVRESVPAHPHPARGRHGAALRADVLARAHPHPQDAAAEVVLRRPRQRTLRGDHPAARVLPDPGRARDPARPGRRDRRRDRRAHPGRAGLRLVGEDPASAGRAAASCSRTCPVDVSESALRQAGRGAGRRAAGALACTP